MVWHANNVAKPFAMPSSNVKWRVINLLPRAKMAMTVMLWQQ